MERQDRKDFDSASRFLGSRFLLWVIVFLVVGAIIGGVTWGVRVATSDVKGAGDATVKVNSGENRIASQEEFEKLYAKIQAYDKNLDQAAKDKAEHAGDSWYAENYSGLVMQCNNAVAQYNADARSISRAKWRSEVLPFEIDQTDTRFDCKETAK